MATFTRWVLAHRKLVAWFWILVTIVGGATSGLASKAMDQDLTVPGREGSITNEAIAKTFGETGGNGAPLVAVVHLPRGRLVTDPAALQDLRAVEQRLREGLRTARVSGFGSTENPAFASEDRRTAFAIAYPRPDPDDQFGDNPTAAKDATKALKNAAVVGTPVLLTGLDVLAIQSGGSGGPGVLIEALVGGIGALAVLAFVFGSLLAFVPLLMSLPAILGTFLAVYGLTAVTDISPIVQFLIALVGLGVAIDYALIVVVRWREERANGAVGDDAIVTAMETAGRAVVFSGTTVAVGLLALVALPLPFLRSVGIGGMLIPLVSVAVALTLLPVVLAAFGDRMNWPHRRTDEMASPGWTRWARGVVRHRVVAAAASLLVLGALVVAAAHLKPGVPDATTIAPSGGPAVQGLRALRDSGIGTGALLPHEILVRGTSSDTAAAAVAKVPGVHGAVAPYQEGWRAGTTALVAVFGVPDASSTAGRDLVEDVRTAAHGVGPTVSVGGVQAQNADFDAAVYANFPLMIVLISVITFLLLARAFRSLLLPLKAVLLNIISVAAAWGVLELVWQAGHGSDELFGIAATGAITSWIPLLVFAFLFGLSMDYEVFILARMREEFDATGSTTEAIVRGIGRTGRLVTSAALILFLAFVSMASGPQTDVKVMATGLAAGILIDATIIRALLVPAAVSLFGRWNWVLPPGPARLLRVAPSMPPRSAPADGAG